MLAKLLETLKLTENACRVCKEPFSPSSQGFVCEGCLQGIKPAYPIEYNALDYISSYRVFALYEEPLSEVIRLVKFRSILPLAHELGSHLSEHLGEYIEEISPDIITYIPVHLFRFWRRGFDHNREILKGAGIHTVEVLMRLKHSKPLASLSKEKRFSVVKDAFRVRKAWIDEVEGKRILVFDDILTTGATSTSVARALLSLGAEEVFFYFVAREV